MTILQKIINCREVRIKSELLYSYNVKFFDLEIFQTCCHYLILRLVNVVLKNEEFSTNWRHVQIEFQILNYLITKILHVLEVLASLLSRFSFFETFMISLSRLSFLRESFSISLFSIMLLLSLSLEKSTYMSKKKLLNRRRLVRAWSFFDFDYLLIFFWDFCLEWSMF